MSETQAYYQTPNNVIAVGVAFAALDSAFVGLRFWARRKQNQALRVDDWLLVPATLLTMAMSALTIYGVLDNSIAHRTEIPPGYKGRLSMLETEQLTMRSRVEYGFSLMLPISLACIKLSFLFLYNHIIGVKRRDTIRWVLIAMISIILMWAVAFFLVTLFKCGVAFWAIWGTRVDLVSQCVDTMQTNFGFCLSDSITDVMIGAVPIPLIWRLKLSRANKVATGAVFLVGGVAIAASFIRLVMAIKAIQRGFNPDADEVLNTTQYLYWGIVECGVGILCACLLAISTLFQSLSRGYIQRQMTSSSNSQSLNSVGTGEAKNLQSRSSRSGEESSCGGDGDTGRTDSIGNDVVPYDLESRGINRLNGDPSNFDSYTTDSSWRTRVPSVHSEEHLHPPPMAHHMKELRGAAY